MKHTRSNLLPTRNTGTWAQEFSPSPCPVKEDLFSAICFRTGAIRMLVSSVKSTTTGQKHCSINGRESSSVRSWMIIIQQMQPKAIQGLIPRVSTMFNGERWQPELDLYRLFIPEPHTNKKKCIYIFSLISLCLWGISESTQLKENAYAKTVHRKW